MFLLASPKTRSSINSRALKIRDLAHSVSDKIYQSVTGIRGAFSTRLAYVSVIREGDDFTYRLQVADADVSTADVADLLIANLVRPVGVAQLVVAEYLNLLLILRFIAFLYALGCFDGESE